MGLLLNKIDDPRDRLDKARRMELYEFAKANGVREIVQDMPAILMRRILRQKGLTRISIPHRALGATAQRPGDVAFTPQPDNAVTIDASDDLMRQWKREQAAPPPVDDNPYEAPNQPNVPRARPQRPKSEINRLRDQCKQLGIKMGRSDRTADLKRKIEEHGQQDAAQRHQ